MTSLSSANMNRVIALVDMDCFYVQVVQRKDPTLTKKPCAVVQYNDWQGGRIIAVGYEARKYGVTRHMRGDQAKEKCPEIVLVRVPESRGIADLTLFNEASAEVIKVLAEFEGCLERASIDEAYMDLTSTINRTLAGYNLEEIALKTFATTHLVGNKEINLKEWLNILKSDENHYRLAVGAVIADKMRNTVKEKTGFSCSAGVGPNKMLAKVVAGFHKPNQQTLVLPVNVPEMFKTTEIRKIHGLGGKIGELLIKKFHVEFMAQLLNISMQDLQEQIGAKHVHAEELIYGLCRGIDDTPVQPKQLPNSVGCSKNFRGFQKLKTKTDVQYWLGIFSDEIIERLEKEKEQNNREATLVTVGWINDLNQRKSRRCNLVRVTLQELKDEAFKKLLQFNQSKSSTEWTPAITNLKFNASKFISACKSKSISTYMCTAQNESRDTNVANHVTTSRNSLKSKSPVKSNISEFFTTVEKNSSHYSTDSHSKTNTSTLVSDSRTTSILYLLLKC